jgi:hypothetical protein
LRACAPIDDPAHANAAVRMADAILRTRDRAADVHSSLKRERLVGSSRFPP